MLARLSLLGVFAVMMAPVQQQQERRARRGGGVGEGPVPVLAVPAKRADVPVYLEGVGTARALNTVTVRPQVEGKLISVEPSRKARTSRKARCWPASIRPPIRRNSIRRWPRRRRIEALLANARMDLERYTRLAASNSITKQQADTQRSTVAQLEAQVRVDQGAVDNARAILAYTTITAPINGRTGIRLVDEGNIVRASDATGIVVLTEIQPISVIFNLPQQVVSQVNAAFAKGPLPVEALAADNEAVVDRGTLHVVDNQVDPTTGTVKLKAEFPNANLQLWSGQFVNVRMLIDTLQQVVVVPTAAVQRGPDGAFVFVVQRWRDSRGAARHRGAAGRHAGGDFQRRAGGRSDRHDRLRPACRRHARAGNRRRGPAATPAARSGGRRQNRPARLSTPAPPPTPPAGTRPARQQRSSTGAAASPAP